MDRQTTRTVIQILKDRANVLRLAICLLLMFSLPVMAQGSCEMTHPESRFLSATCVTFEQTTPLYCADGVTYTYKYNDPTSICGNTFESYNDPDLILKRFNRGSTIPADQRNIYDLGVDPATLSPEALDLNIFPSFEISAQLSLVPSLSYSPDNVMARMGRLQYGPPKIWQNHYGEIVVMIGATASQKVPVGAGSLNDDHPRDPVETEMQVFFINANGQQVNFYPDPARMSADNAPSVASGQIGRWFSEDGGYRLIDTDADAQNPSDAFQFELKTPEGLTFSFEPYSYRLDAQKEALSRHYRVTQITDRYQNHVAISYRDEVEPNYPNSAGKTLQPYNVEGHANANVVGTSNTKLQELRYRYDDQNRLEQLILPGVGAAQTQTFKFYYLDSGEVKDVTLPDSTTTNRVKLNNIYETTLSSVVDQSERKVVLPPIKSVGGHYENGTLFLNFDHLGFVPEIGIDFQEQYPPSHQNFAGQFRSSPYRFHLDDGSNSGLFVTPGLSRQVFSELKFAADSIHYRYQIDPDDYPGTVGATYPDGVTVVPDDQATVANDDVTVGVFPRLKQDDLLVWIDGNQEIQNAQLDYIDVTPTANGTSYRYPLTDASVTLTGSEALHYIRKDQRDRIAEIEYPGVSGSTRKRMLFKYAEHSRNHAEIEEVLVFDEPVSEGPAKLLSQTTYTYEQVLVQIAAEDLEPMLPDGIPEAEWRNCVRTGRDLDQVGSTAGVTAGIGLLRRHELIDMLRHKRFRYFEPGLEPDVLENCIYDDYRDLRTYYGGAWRFSLMGKSTINESQPGQQPDEENTCDQVEWGISQKPFAYTWQINPDGSAQVFDLSADGVGLDPVLAYANTGVRVFKTYAFNTLFNETFSASNFGHFLGAGALPYSPYYQYAPSYAVNHTCTNCTIPDLEQYPTFPQNRAIPTMDDIFGLQGTLAYAATIQLFEPIPLYGYSLLADIDPGEPHEKVALGALHGSIQHTDGPASDRTYYRVSAVKGLDHVITNDDTCAEGLIDKYFRGLLTSNVAAEGFPTVSDIEFEVAWAYGGPLNSNSCLTYLHQRQKNHRLRPHAQIQLQKLSGLAWNDTQNILDLAPNGASKVSPWVVEASRYSNGGYLGEGSAASAADGAGQSTLSGVSAPTGVQEGDYFYYNKQMYQLVSDVNSGSVTIKPEIGTTAQSLTNLKFYRFYDPDAPTTFPYLGYDHFGNNAFKATYKRNELKFPNAQNKANGDDEGLVPDFFDAGAVPFTLSLNDSTALGNQDETDWQYFGRTSRVFETGLKSLYAEDDQGNFQEHTSWHTGMLTDVAFPTGGAAYHWLPTDRVSYFLPVTLTGNLDDLSISKIQSITPSAHVEDLRTTYRYYKPIGVYYSHAFSNGNPMSHGRVSLEWTGKGDTYPSDSQFTVTRYGYDAYGWLEVRDTATIVSNAGVYGMRTMYGHDEATGLVTEEKTLAFPDPTWNSGGGSPEARLVFTGAGHQRSRMVTTYDLLGRKLEEKSFLPDLSTPDDNPFGPITKTSYQSQTQITVETKNHSSDVFQTQMTFTNGQGQTRAVLRQRGGEPNTGYAVYNHYDAFGRQQYTSSEQEIEVATTLADYALPDFILGGADQGGQTKAIYNLRGEPFGTVVFENNVVTQSAWTLKDQDSAGNLSTLQVGQVPQPAVSGNQQPDLLNIKVMGLDAYGLLNTVTDYQMDGPNGFWTDETETDLLLEVASPGLPLAVAEYSYNRMNQVIKAEVGNDQETQTIQTRNFVFDQRDRLREESHPEMVGVTVSYGDFDHFGNPQKVVHTNGSGILRQWLSTYDTAGNMLSHTSGPSASVIKETTVYIYNYEAQFGGGPNDPQPSAYPERPRFIRHTDADGDVTAYWHRYHPDTGLMTERRLYHNRADFPGESTNVATADLTVSATPTVAGDLAAVTYTYDALGRMVTMTYPDHVTGVTEPTTLSYTYDDDHGLLYQVDDEAFDGSLTLMAALTYGVGDQLVNVDFATPGVGKNRLGKQYDLLNRIQSWGVSWNGGTTSVGHGRTYRYDANNRIHSVRFENDSGGFDYAYDGLGQIAQAKFTNPDDQTTKTWDYTYDGEGFGNLVSLKENNNETLDLGISRGSNQLTGTHVNYSALGELKKFESNATVYDMTYNDLGRMATIQVTGGLDANYDYDHRGMRVFTHVDGVSGSGLTDKDTLYFYDQEGMVLCEWVSQQQPDTTWADPRWDKTYLYLAGKSSLTYEHDAVDPGGGSVPAGPSMTQGTFITEPVLQWDDVGMGTYEVQLEDHAGRKLPTISQIEGHEFRHPSLRYGKYKVRARRTGQAWGAWQTVYFMDQASQETVGRYSLNWEGGDRSYYHNNSSTTAAGYVEGKNESAVYLAKGETATITTPHAQLTGTHGSVSFWVKPDLPGTTSTPGPYRDLWTLGDIRLQANEVGKLRLKWTGSSPFQPNASLNDQDWQHIVLVYGDGGIKVYLDNALSFNMTGAPTSTLTSEDMQWGNASSSVGVETGLDEIRCFNKALSTSEIEDLYTEWD